MAGLSGSFGDLNSGLSGGGFQGNQFSSLSTQIGGGDDSSNPNDASVVGGIGVLPNSQPTAADGASFGSTLNDMIIKNPSQAQNYADDLVARAAAGQNIDPQDLAVATAKAGIEIQMSTRTISQAVQGLRTLFQMQI
jgi:flagellar hook-basal body complex protein FliE